MSFPRARYLSQQFVEELCSAKGVSDGLVHEIERVIFESHSQDDRDWATDFAALRDQRTGRFQQAREREAEAISDVSDRIASEFEKESLVATLTTQVRALIVRARALEHLGLHTEARRDLETVLARWAPADRGLPLVDEARTIQARLAR